MNFEYGPADQEALERRNARALAAILAEQRNVDVRALEERLRKADNGETVEVSHDEMQAILDGRHTIHGEFTDDAAASQSIKAAIRAGRNWQGLSDIQMEALELIATKIGRIMSGDPNHKDHWIDIQGYARLVSERL